MILSKIIIPTAPGHILKLKEQLLTFVRNWTNTGTILHCRIYRTTLVLAHPRFERTNGAFGHWINKGQNWQRDAKDENQVIYHTGPHHDDIMLGIMPYTNRQLRNASNSIHFSIMTSGFTAVTNQFLIKAVEDTLELIERRNSNVVLFRFFSEKGILLNGIKMSTIFLTMLHRTMHMKNAEACVTV